MKFYPTPYAQRLDEKRAADRRATRSFIGGCVFMALLVAVLDLAARVLGL